MVPNGKFRKAVTTTQENIVAQRRSIAIVSGVLDLKQDAPEGKEPCGIK